MRKVLLLLVGTAVLWLPAVSVAGDSSKPAAGRTGTADTARRASNPARICKTQRAFGKCVSAMASHNAEQGKDSPEKEGEDESASREQDSGKHDREDSGAESRGRSGANPAMTCKAMSANDRAHFQTAYGTRPNAFGRCVSSHATRLSER